MATTEIEKENLEAHVELCAERYKFLETKISDMGERMTKVEQHLVEIREIITKKAGEQNNNNSDKTIISIGTAVMVAMISTITVLLVNYINK